ncbi:porin family protein [Bradyrhizobium arachidis]|uniref:outer membrane protein n=1 Tax=Bradyrhizobium TaxID=374 RepID=UPI001889F0D0|nr:MULTISPECIES: outer membrane protein [Bradyrhizobium]MDN4988869.1 porin family protein [Bradyrhizobium sp. WYCCWR 13022]QOZ52706.1 porin family protein [Bradyrhizobium sp. CCBAU 53338]UVO39823.1 porin family protein [Bradyrhizobium arachidis]
MKRFLLAAAMAVLGTVAAQAADLAAHYTKAPMMAAAYNWTGFYVGGNVGGQWGSADAATTTLDPPVAYFANSSVPAIAAVGAQHVNSSSVTGGLTAGYNWQVNSAVFGLEGDINYFGFKGSATGSALYPCCAPTGFTVNSQVSADWLATIRGRIGFLATPSWLIYATGGAAIADVKGNFNFSDTFAAATESGAIRDTRVGWTAGVGGEYAVGNGWSLKAEYLYVDLGRASMTSNNLVAGGPLPAQTFTHSFDIKSNIVRIGVNYKFGGPVVARY